MVGQLSDWINQRSTWWLCRRSTLRSLRSLGLDDNAYRQSAPDQLGLSSIRISILLLRLPLFLPLTRESTPYFSKIFNAAFSVLYANWALPPLFRDSTNRPTPLPSRPLYRLGLRSTGQGKSCDVITGCGDLRETLLPSHERIRVTSRNWAIVRVLRSELERSNFSFGL